MIEPKDFDDLCKILYKDYGRDKHYMQRTNSAKYKDKAERMLQLLKDRGYISEV